MPDRLVTPPGSAPVSLALAKRHLVIEHTADDVLIAQLIEAATQYAEKHCNRGFVEQVWQSIFSCFPSANLGHIGYAWGLLGVEQRWQALAKPNMDPHIELRRGNLIALEDLEVSYYDTAGVSQTLAPSMYLADDASIPGRIRLAPNQCWPSTQARWDAVRVTYTVGWPDDAVPAPIVQALLLLISQMYENRIPEITGTIVASIKFSFEALLAPYRIHAL